MTRRVYFVGPLPPPVGGFSTINQHVHDRLKDGCELITYDMAPRKRRLPITQLLAFVVSRGASRDDSLYVALSGGRRQAIDACFIALARVRRLRIFIHHHSFAYINSRSRLAALTFRLAGRRAQHIVLCSTMRSKLASRYALDSGSVRVVSNAAFMPKSATPGMRTAAANGEIVLGYISYLTEEKGILHFITLCRRLIDQGIKVSGLIAGAGPPEMVARVKREIEGYDRLSYVGVVAGETKEKFFADIDWLVFPSSYVNEAEPLVLWEAQSRGVICIATDVGCIRCIIPNQIPTYDSATKLVNSLSVPATFNSIAFKAPVYAEETCRQFFQIFDLYSGKLKDLLDDISNRKMSV